MRLKVTIYSVGSSPLGTTATNVEDARLWAKTFAITDEDVYVVYNEVAEVVLEVGEV